MRLFFAVLLTSFSATPAALAAWYTPYNECELATLTEQEIQQSDARQAEMRRCHDENPTASRLGRCTFTSNGFWSQGRERRESVLERLEGYRQKARAKGMNCDELPNRIRDKR